MSGMAEGHDRYARGLKPRALDRGVGSLNRLVVGAIRIPFSKDSFLVTFCSLILEKGVYYNPKRTIRICLAPHG